MDGVALGLRACSSLATARVLSDKAQFVDPSVAALTGIPRYAKAVLIEASGDTIRWRDDLRIGNVLGAAVGAAGKVRIYSPYHGLTTGDQVTVKGVLGCTEANVTALVTVIDVNYFDLTGTVFVNPYLAGTVASFANNGSGAVRCTDVAHGLATGDEVIVTGLPSNGGRFPVTRVDADNFDLVGSIFNPKKVVGTLAWASAGGDWYCTDRLPTASRGERLAAGDSLLFSGNLRRLAFIQEVGSGVVIATFRQ